MNTRRIALDYIKKHYETELKPASELFDKDGAESAISAAGEVFNV